jgi:hypothetical protein
VLSALTINLLEQAGWKKERKIDISNYIAHLEKEGYKVNDFAKVFLSEFAELKVIHPHHKIKEYFDSFIINPLKFTNYTLDTVKEYEERVNESLTPVGDASNGYLILTISESGKVYAGYDDFLQRIGCNGYEAIMTLCEGIEENKVRIDNYTKY